MTNTHRNSTNRTAARIAAVSAFGIGAALAVPGIAAAQTEAPDLGASLADLNLGTDVSIDAGSLSFNLNLDADATNPGSVELGSLGVSPNTGSEIIDGTGTDSALPGSSDEDATGGDDSGSLNTGSLTGSADDDATGGGTEPGTDTGSGDFDPVETLSGLSSEGTEGDANLNLDLLLGLAAGSVGGEDAAA